MNSTETPGGSGIPAGWYDDPSGEGLRWWDGEQWTEHVHTAESAAAASAAGSGDGSHEGAPPRDLVKLRESIRGRGAKGVGMVLGAAVLVIVVIALLVSGGGENKGGAEPGAGTPGAGQLYGGSNRAVHKQIKKLEKTLKGQHLPKAEKQALQAQLKALKKATKSDDQGQGGQSQKSSKKKTTPGEEGN